MAETPAKAEARFARLAQKLAQESADAGAFRPGFGTHALFVGRKMYATLDASGALVLKLPPSRVAALIERGAGAGWSPGTGKALREYVAIAPDRERTWLALARESRAYMAGKAGTVGPSAPTNV